jgi:hypothetical protein
MSDDLNGLKLVTDYLSQWSGYLIQGGISVGNAHLSEFP